MYDENVDTTFELKDISTLDINNDNENEKVTDIKGYWCTLFIFVFGIFWCFIVLFNFLLSFNNLMLYFKFVNIFAKFLYGAYILIEYENGYNALATGKILCFQHLVYLIS